MTGRQHCGERLHGRAPRTRRWRRGDIRRRRRRRSVRGQSRHEPLRRLSLRQAHRASFGEAPMGVPSGRQAPGTQGWISCSQRHKEKKRPHSPPPRCARTRLPPRRRRASRSTVRSSLRVSLGASPQSTRPAGFTGAVARPESQRLGQRLGDRAIDPPCQSPQSDRTKQSLKAATDVALLRNASGVNSA